MLYYPELGSLHFWLFIYKDADFILINNHGPGWRLESTFALVLEKLIGSSAVRMSCSTMCDCFWRSFAAEWGTLSQQNNLFPSFSCALQCISLATTSGSNFVSGSLSFLVQVDRLSSIPSIPSEPSPLGWIGWKCQLTLQLQEKEVGPVLPGGWCRTAAWPCPSMCNLSIRLYQCVPLWHQADFNRQVAFQSRSVDAGIP